MTCSPAARPWKPATSKESQQSWDHSRKEEEEAVGAPITSEVGAVGAPTWEEYQRRPSSPLKSRTHGNRYEYSFASNANQQLHLPILQLPSFSDQLSPTHNQPQHSLFHCA
ncbi:hypothetical protein NDU88_005793 [Pleurodeles waltl]|uniref:Uncharacterized protein n=1 Tax=Pleurodeles waltl TaxID=8319 RepID=A0AAV7SMT1_PLEWA|nr:hypothetical protein NDU88_005793 [Pleurodeles waltl]